MNYGDHSLFSGSFNELICTALFTKARLWKTCEQHKFAIKIKVIIALCP
jgi:hypothetical protein